MYKQGFAMNICFSLVNMCNQPLQFNNLEWITRMSVSDTIMAEQMHRFLRKNGLSLCVGCLAFGGYVAHEKSVTVRHLISNRLKHESITKCICGYAYFVRYHVPFVVSDILILSECIKRSKEFPRAPKRKLITFGAINIAICIIAHLIQLRAFPIKSIHIFNKLIATKTLHRIEPFISEIDDLLDYNLDYVPPLKKIIWSFLIDVDIEELTINNYNINSCGQAIFTESDKLVNKYNSNIKGIETKEIIFVKQHIQQLKRFVRLFDYDWLNSRDFFFEKWFWLNYKSLINDIKYILQIQNTKDANNVAVFMSYDPETNSYDKIDYHTRLRNAKIKVYMHNILVYLLRAGGISLCVAKYLFPRLIIPILYKITRIAKGKNSSVMTDYLIYCLARDPAMFVLIILLALLRNIF